MIVSASIFLKNEGTYGNDEESIVEVIRSIDGYGEGSIEILDIKDLGEDRFVSFLDNNQPTFIQFTKNLDGNYEWRFIRSGNPTFTAFFEHVRNGEYDGAAFWVVTTNENEIAKMELIVNREVIEQEFPLKEKSVTWIPLPESDGRYMFDYTYYDKDGNEIE